VEGNAFENDDYENELLQLRLALEEKTTELTQTQIEAKDYIERLHSEMMEIKEFARQQNQETENGIVEHMAEELKEVKATNAQLQQNVQDLGVRLDSAEKSLGIANQEKADLRIQKDRLNGKIEEANYSIKFTNEEKSRLSAELLQVKTLYEDSKVQNDELRKLYDAICVEKLELGSLLKLATRKCEDFESKIEDLTQQHSRLRAMNELLESEKKQLSFEKDKIFVELKAAQIEIEHFKKLEEKQSNQFKIIESERDQLRLENLRLSSENNQALRNLESTENKKESQDVKMKNLEVEILKLDKAGSEKDSKISSLETKLKNIETENKTLLGQLNLVKAHNEELSHKQRVTSSEAYATLESELFNLRNETQLIKCDLQAREKSLEYTEQALDQEKKKAKEYYDKLLQYESEIYKKNDFIEELERRFSERTSAGHILESVKLQQLFKSSEDLEKEKKKLKEAFEHEHEQVIILTESLVKIKEAESNAAKQVRVISDEIMLIIYLTISNLIM
jgi:chromosome segregation ATPase